MKVVFYDECFYMFLDFRIKIVVPVVVAAVVVAIWGIWDMRWGALFRVIFNVFLYGTQFEYKKYK